MNEEWVSLSSIARELDVAESTARRWASLFGEFLQSKGHGAGRKFHGSARDVLKRVQTLYASNFTAEQITEQLQIEFSIYVDAESPEETTSVYVPRITPEEMIQMFGASMADYQRRAMEEMQSMREQIAATTAENERLRQIIDERFSESEKRAEERERRAEERDRMLTETLRQMNERAQSEQKKSFWQRLRGN